MLVHKPHYALPLSSVANGNVLMYNVLSLVTGHVILYLQPILHMIKVFRDVFQRNLEPLCFHEGA